MDFDEAHKNIVGERLTRDLARALQEGKITEEQAATISGYILDNIDTIQAHETLITFLTNITKQWPIFSNILTMEQSESIEQKEDEAISKVENLIKENKIDEALKTAESATQQEDIAPIPQEVASNQASEMISQSPQTPIAEGGNDNGNS